MKQLVTPYAFQPAYAWALVTVLTCACLTLFVSFQVGFFALLFALIAWFVWKYPEEGFLLLIILAPLLPMLKITQTIETFSLVKDSIIITLFLRLFVVPLLQKKLPYRRNILIAPIIALVIWAGIATLRSDSLVLGIVRLRDIVLYILAYGAVLYLPKHDTHAMQRRLYWFSATLSVTLLLAAWQWFFAQDSAVLRFDPVRHVWIPRLSSVLAHPSIYGQYLVTGSALAAAIFVSAVKKNVRFLAGLGFVILLPFIFLTYSRAVWLALAMVAGVMTVIYIIPRKVGWVRWAAVLSITLVLVALTRFTPAGGLLRSIVDPTYGSNEERVEFLVRLIAPVTNTQAIIGQGLGDVFAQNFRTIDLQTYDLAAGASRAVQLTKNATLVDNQYLKTFIEMGVIGLVLYGWMYWRIAATAIRHLHVISLWSLGFLAAFVLQAFFIDIWDVFPTNVLFWVVAGLLSANLKPAPPFAQAINQPQFPVAK